MSPCGAWATRAVPRLTVVLLALLAASCVQFSWERNSRYGPVSSAALAALRPGESDLTQCLSAFGAPLWVWEDVEGGRSGAALAWGWVGERDLGVRVSVPVSHGLAASVDYDRIDRRMKGVVLFFDEGWTLVRWRTGMLRDLSHEVRRPPAALEEDA